MIITVNKQQVEVDINTSIEQLLEQLNTPSKGLAVAIDDNIICSSEWSNYILKAEYNILLIRATQGG